MVRRLRPSEVSQTVVDDINHLLRSQHSKANTVDEESLLAHMKRSQLVVAWNDDGRILAMGVKVRTYAVSHSFASIHNLIVRNGCDALSLGKRIVDLLIEEAAGIEFIEASAWPEDLGTIDILTIAGFLPRSKLQYRLKRS